MWWFGRKRLRDMAGATTALERRVHAAERAVQALCPHDTIIPAVHMALDGALEYASFGCALCKHVDLYGHKWLGTFVPINLASPFSDMPPRYRKLLKHMGIDVLEKG